MRTRPIIAIFKKPDGPLMKWEDLGRLSIPQVIAINHWIVILIVWAILILPSVALEKKKL